MQPLYSSSLIDYKLSIFNLATNLKKMQILCQDMDLKNSFELISDIINCLETNYLKIAVVGCFNRGKSTFINALLGQEILPSDILATTATLSRITYRSNPGVKIYFKDGRKQEIEITKLADYITKLTSASEAVATNIEEAIVYYPLSYCQNNVEIIDTPGLDDDGDMTVVTSEVIKKCDVVIMIISAISPFSMTEGDFLTNQLLSSGVNRIIFVVNQIDSLSSTEDVNKIINLIKNRIENCIQEWSGLQPNPQEHLTKISKIQIFGISAFQALQAKSTKNIPLLAKSRFVNFEHALKKIINEERGLIQLKLFTSRTIKCAGEIFETVVNQEVELTIAKAKLKQTGQLLNEEIDMVRRIKNEVIASIDNIFISLKKQAYSLYSKLEYQAKESVLQVIASNNITPSEQSNLASQLLNSIKNVLRYFITKIYKETRQILNIALVNIRKFIKLFYQAMQRLKEEMIYLEIDTTICDDMITVVPSFYQACDELSHKKFSKLSLSFPNNPNIFIFEEKPGGFIGAGAAIGFFVAGPFGAALGASVGAGITNSLNTSKFKEKYQLQVMEAIDTQLINLNINQTVDSYIYQVYFQTKEIENLFFAEIDFQLDKTQNLLAEFCGNREETIVVKYNKLQQTQVELQKIFTYTQELYEQIKQLNK